MALVENISVRRLALYLEVLKMSDIYCPECDALCKEDAYERPMCPLCHSRWTVCPDCGDTVDLDEEWDIEKGLCFACADDDGTGIEVLSFEDFETMSDRIRDIFKE
jgi:hypothetical protein